MPRILLTLILAILFLAAHTQPITPAAHGLKSFLLQDKILGDIEFFLDTTNLHKKAPLFIEINGSGGLPLCIYIKGKGFSTTYNTYNEQLKNTTQQNYHYIILSKPGTPFCDTIRTTDDAKSFHPQQLIADYPFSHTYTKTLSLDWRVAATKKVISYLLRKGYCDKSRIVAYGYSEGAQVVPTLAVADHRITHIISVVGSGLNQLYDDILTWRIKASQGQISHSQAQDSINAAFKRITDIYDHPDNTQLSYSGHSYKRWASFGRIPPVEQFKKLNIPIYMIVATADENSPIYGLDYIPLEFIRLGKKNLTYETCIGCDHYLNNAATNYNDKIMKWLTEK